MLFPPFLFLLSFFSILLKLLKLSCSSFSLLSLFDFLSISIFSLSSLKVVSLYILFSLLFSKFLFMLLSLFCKLSSCSFNFELKTNISCFWFSKKMSDMVNSINCWFISCFWDLYSFLLYISKLSIFWFIKLIFIK